MGASADIAHVLGGTVLVLSLVLLAQHRTRAAIDIYAVQAWVLAAAAAWQSWTQTEPLLGALALAILAAKGVLIPALLHRTARGSPEPGAGGAGRPGLDGARRGGRHAGDPGRAQHHLARRDPGA